MGFVCHFISSLLFGYKFCNIDNEETKRNQSRNRTSIIGKHQDLIIETGYQFDYPDKKAGDNKQYAPQAGV